MLLRGRRILVTGASARRGIGRATCRLGLELGASVIACDRDAEGLAETADELGPGVTTIRCDITSREDCRGTADTVREHGGIDAIVHCAGVAEPMGIADLTRERYDRMMDVNLWGTIQLTQALLPAMLERQSGSVVCISSAAGQRGGGLVGGLHYSASKAAILGFVKGLAREVGASNIRVNAVAPGLVDTDMTIPFMAPDQRLLLARQAVLNRLASPEEVAGACLFLASDLAGYITGATIDVNGGLHIH
jgi:NAD(P)-dependent dehydrogenase (short-subunit alcohol dehydrogenase family)